MYAIRSYYEKHGEDRNYTEDGWLQSIFTYDKNKIVGIAYYDSKGNPLADVHDPSGNMEYETYYSTGELLAKGIV